jgi:3-hydroxy-9,10-secoandrosta-1,3,5(10)-triene-9,17-dione monooxygenase reductase component
VSADRPPSAATTPEAFRRLMGRWATGVAVVTSHLDGADTGLTVNALLSVTLDPPTVLISLNTVAESTPLVEKSGVFAASFLTREQRAVSERFAKAIPAREKFEGLLVHRGRTGAPLLDGSLGAVECRVRQTLAVGDHRLFVGDVVAVENGQDAPPLLFYLSRYHELEDAGGLKNPPPRE